LFHIIISPILRSFLWQPHQFSDRSYGSHQFSDRSYGSYMYSRPIMIKLNSKSRLILIK